MDRHPVVLQLGIETQAVEAGEPQPLKRVDLGEEEDDEEEGEDAEKRAAHVRHELPVAPPVQKDRDRREDRKQERPEDQRPALPGPEPRDLEEGVQLAVRVVDDVVVLVPVAQEGRDDPRRDQHQQNGDDVDGALAAQYQVAAADPAPANETTVPQRATGRAIQRAISPRIVTGRILSTGYQILLGGLEAAAALGEDRVGAEDAVGPVLPSTTTSASSLKVSGTTSS